MLGTLCGLFWFAPGPWVLGWPPGLGGWGSFVLVCPWALAPWAWRWGFPMVSRHRRKPCAISLFWFASDRPHHPQPHPDPNPIPIPTTPIPIPALPGNIGLLSALIWTVWDCSLDDLGKSVCHHFNFSLLGRRAFPFPFWGRRAFSFPFIGERIGGGRAEEWRRKGGRRAAEGRRKGGGVLGGKGGFDIIGNLM